MGGKLWLWALCVAVLAGAVGGVLQWALGGTPGVVVGMLPVLIAAAVVIAAVGRRRGGKGH